MFQPADRISLTRSLVEPISTSDAIATVIAALVPVVCEKLTARGEGARQLDFLCVRVDGSIQAVRVGTSDPTADVTRLMRLLGDQIPQIAPEFGIETVILTVSANEPLEAGPERSVLPDVGASSEHALPATLIDRLLNVRGLFRFTSLRPGFPPGQRTGSLAFPRTTWQNRLSRARCSGRDRTFCSICPSGCR
ncbi:DNA polymerase Y subunit UmuC family protein [Gluconobacter oxydans]|uniref:hypothetical protein n=1 Tax=Gluconobacter oxydans TaxID=442 RepID=UPI0026484F24|nr:hypothetical protein [Gluconobacter oxydans]WKE49640.1 hypothetical protein NUJ38_13830 [Gluconobacter oxydans]